MRPLLLLYYKESLVIRPVGQFQYLNTLSVEVRNGLALSSAVDLQTYLGCRWGVNAVTQTELRYR
jgi:hypothetical protein